METPPDEEVGKAVRPILVPPPARPLPPPGPTTFSVMIPAYQAADTIAQAVESALAQTHPAHEVIVCDDGSTDDLQGSLEPYLDRIVLIRKANGGGASALNAAARRATGEFVTILDADDAYSPQRLEALAELALARPDLDILTTDAYYEVDGRLVGRINGPANPFVTQDQRREIFRRSFIFAPALRRRRLAAIGWFDESFAIAYDWDCWLRMILDGALAGSVAEPLVFYRLREGSLSSRRAPSFRERVVLCEKAARDPRLDAADRRALESALRAHRRDARLVAAQEAVSSAQKGAWREVFPVLLTRDVPRRSRMAAVAHLLAPGRARRRNLVISERARGRVTASAPRA